MGYGTSTFAFKKKSLLRSKTCLDFTQETGVKQLQITGTEPEGTIRRILFEIDGVIYKLTPNNILDEYKLRLEIDNVLRDGSTVGELLALRELPFAGKKVYPIIAMAADESAQVMPRIKIAAEVNSFNDIYATNEISPIYELPENAKIISVRSDFYTAGNASVNCYCKIFNGSWSDWLYLSEAADKPATKIQFKINCVLTTLDGSDFAKVNSITANFVTDKNKLAVNSQEFISLAQDFSADLHTCYLLVNHSPIVDCNMQAFINFSKKPVRRENVMLGTTAGESQTLYLQFNGVVDTGVDHDSIHIEVDGKTFQNFHFDTENSTVTLQADAGQIITASYDCGVDAEFWEQMELDFSNLTQTRFTFRTDEDNLRAATIKIVLTKKSGNAEENFGAGNGKLQTFALAHLPTDLNCNVPFKADGQIVKAVAPVGDDISVSYSWRGVIPKVFSYIAGFSV